MSYEKQERELRLKDLFFGVLRRWRSILVLAVVGALALGGLRYYVVYRNYSGPVDRSTYLVANEEYQQWLAAKQYEVAWLEERIEQQQEYLSESVMMNIDPTNVCRARLELSVLGTEELLTQQILDQYRVALSSDELGQKAAQELEIESRYFWELLTVKQEESIEEESVRQYISVTINHSQMQSVERMLELVQAQIAMAEAQIQTDVGQHTLNAILVEQGVRVDNTDLAARQWAEKQRLTNYETGLTNVEKTFVGRVAPVDPGAWRPSPLRSGAKYALLGFALGGALGCGLGVLWVLFGDKLYSASDLQGRYRVKVLGSVAGSGKRCAIDRLLDRLEGRITKDTPENDRQLSLLLSKLTQGQRVLLWGQQPLTENLRSRLDSSLIVMQSDSTQALEQLNDCDSVILVAVCGKDSYRQIGKTMELAGDFGKKTIGCIVAEY